MHFEILGLGPGFKRGLRTGESKAISYWHRNLQFSGFSPHIFSRGQLVLLYYELLSHSPQFSILKHLSIKHKEMCQGQDKRPQLIQTRGAWFTMMSYT